MAEVRPVKVKKYRVPTKEREYFTNNLALLLGASVPVGDALSSLRETSKSRPLQKAVEQISHDIEEGRSLHQALDRSGISTSQTLALVRLGEESGRLVDNLQVAARQEEKQRLLRSKVRSAMLYPSFVLGLTVIIGLGVAWFLLPKLSDTFAQLDVQLPLISRIFISFGEFLRADGYWAVPSMIFGLLMLVYILFAAPKTKILGRRLAFHIPGVSRLLHEIEIARFGYLMGTLLQSGLAVTQALNLLQAATTAPNYKRFYKHLYRAFDDGYSFKEGMKQFKRADKLLPPALQQMVIAGEHSGSLPETLEKIGAMYEEKSDLTTENLETILEPILLLIVWLGVMAVAVAVIIPVYSLIGGLDAVK